KGIPPGIDIALGRPVIASSETPEYPASNSVNGDPATHWRPGAATADAHLIVVLDEQQSLNGTGVTWVGRAPDRYDIQFSLDGENWTQFMGTRSDGNTLTSFDYAAGPWVQARFVRMS